MLYKRFVTKSMDWSLGVKTETKLVGQALRAIPLVFGHLTAGYVRAVWRFAIVAVKLYKTSGYRGAAIYLKTCYVLLQHVAGGHVDASPWALGCNVSRTRRGIPRVIPVQHRRLIATGDVDLIRFWLTLFGLYRVLPFKGALKLKTIYQPGKDLSSFMVTWKEYVPTFLERLQEVTKSSLEVSLYRDLGVRKIPAITKASPNSHGFSSMVGLPLDLITWWLDPPMRAALVQWLELTESRAFLHDIKSIWNGFTVLSKRYCEKENIKVRLDPIQFLQGLRNEDLVGAAWVKALWGKPLFFGRLGFKEEPGKIRVFAMVNLITQALMQPLHEWIFRVLRSIPTDGTFDQVAPVERLIKRFVGKEWVASYDLSAATDRLPVAIQVEILRPLLGDQLVNLWAFILVGRPYGLPKVAKSYNLGFTSVFYAVGQPMGALSSWAMLAMTHHALVQFAAMRVDARRRWFFDYAVLGDDIVIADKAVAQEYLNLMETIGVDIGLAKSLVSSTGSLEFAKRTWVKGRSATPFSLAEMSVAVSNIGALEELWRKTLPFGSPIRMAAVARFCGFGYKNLARLPVGFSLNNRLSRLLGYLSRPGGIWPLSFETWVASPGPGRLLGLPWEVQRKIVGVLVVDVLDLIERVLERAKGEINRTFSTALFSGTYKVRKEAVRKDGGRRVSWETKKVYGPILIEMFEEYSVLLERFFKDWVLYSFSSPLSKKASALTIRLRELRKSRSIAGFNGLEATWRWITDLENGLAALPTQLDLFSRADEVRIRPSALIGLWIRIRAKVRREVRGSRKG